MKDWDKVFTTGVHTDSNGNQKIWTQADLDRIVESFNPQYHEPPLVIGHPSDNAPAFGWIEAIKREGNDLLVKYRDVAAEFAEWTKKKLFKKKSISVYPDGSLRHVGYLGAMPPAIKGLPDYQFSDAGKGEAVVYEFSDWRMSTIGRIVMRIRDYLVEKEGADKADNIIGSWEVQDLLTAPQEQETINPGCYSQHEEDEMKVEEVKALIGEALKDQETRFSEQLKGIAESIKGLGTQFSELQKGQAEERAANLRREFAEFLNTPEMLKRVAEGQREATISHMVTLTGAAPVEFGEGDQKKSVSAVEDYKTKLKALPPVVEFSEVVTKETAGEKAKTTMTRREFDALPSDKRLEFSCGGGTLID